jgi:hypothetical protein
VAAYDRLVNAALWTLAGFGVAGAVNFANSWLLEDRRTSLQWRKEREDELRDALVAAKLIADEQGTHAMNYRWLHYLGRTPMRPVAQYPNVLSSRESEAYKRALARLTIIPTETWSGLMSEYHNAQQLRARLEVDGVNAPFPSERMPILKDHAEAADELAAILTDAVEQITRRLTAGRRRRFRRLGRVLPGRPGSGSEAS